MYQAVETDPTNEYAVQQASAMLEKIQQKQQRFDIANRKMRWWRQKQQGKQYRFEQTSSTRVCICAGWFCMDWTSIKKNDCSNWTNCFLSIFPGCEGGSIIALGFWASILRGFTALVSSLLGNLLELADKGSHLTFLCTSCGTYHIKMYRKEHIWFGCNRFIRY